MPNWQCPIGYCPCPKINNWLIHKLLLEGNQGEERRADGCWCEGALGWRESWCHHRVQWCRGQCQVNNHNVGYEFPIYRFLSMKVWNHGNQVWRLPGACWPWQARNYDAHCQCCSTRGRHRNSPVLGASNLVSLGFWYEHPLHQQTPHQLLQVWHI